MFRCVISFQKVASYDTSRSPYVKLNDEVQEWIRDHHGEHSWMMGRCQTVDQWKVMVVFPNEADSVIFKLTFG